MNDIEFKYFEKLVDKYKKTGYESLLPDERIWYNTRYLIDEAEAGGLISFYCSSGADHLQDTMEDLKRLKANSVIKIMLRINNLFPNGTPSTDINKRNAVIDSWDDEKIKSLLEKLDDEFNDIVGKLEQNLVHVVKIVITNKM